MSSGHFAGPLTVRHTVSGLSLDLPLFLFPLSGTRVSPCFGILLQLSLRRCYVSVYDDH